MNSTHYAKTVLARANTDYASLQKRLEDDVTKTELTLVLTDMIRLGKTLDKLKKKLMYGPKEDTTGITPDPRFVNICHSIIGTMTESTEMGEILLKLLQNPNDFDLVNFKEELGDAEWYNTLGIHAVDSTHEEIWTINDNKLAKRFGGVTFNSEGAMVRDTKAEAEVMKATMEAAAPKKEGRFITHANGTYEMETPESSQVKGMRFADNLLEIDFKDKTGNVTSTYVYKNVPFNIVWELMFAPSFGSFFAKNIKAKPDTFPFEKKA